MLQYGYSNFERKGYQHASMNPFFQDMPPNRNEKLIYLTNFFCAGNNTESNPTSLMGLFTDLDMQQEMERFYFQCSGPQTYRDSHYAHGYVQDRTSDSFFQSDFLSLLRAKFYSLEEFEAMPSERAKEYFPDIDLKDIPKCEVSSQQPLSKEKLVQVMYQLLKSNSSRVVLHLDRSGDGITEYSRNVLLQIYEVLPYAVRRSCGFCTSVIPEQLSAGAEKKLPSTVRLLLVNGNEELPNRIRDYIVVKTDSPVETLGLDEKTISFLDMLSHSDGRHTDFFDFAYHAIEKNNAHSIPTLQQYVDVYRAEEMCSWDYDESALSHWAEWYQRNRKVKGIVTPFLEKIAKKISLKSKKEFLSHLEYSCERIPSLASSDTDNDACVVRLMSAVSSEDEMHELAKELATGYIKQVQASTGDKRLGDIPTIESFHYTSDVQALIQKIDLPFQYRGNKILVNCIDILNEEFYQLANAERDGYRNAIKNERLTAKGRIEMCRDFPSLGRVYHDIFEDKENNFPLCHRLQQDDDFATAYDSEVMEQFEKQIPDPRDLDEYKQYVDFYREFRCSIDRKSLPLRRAEELTVLYESLKLQLENAPLKLYCDLVNSDSVYKGLPALIAEEVMTDLRDRLSGINIATVFQYAKELALLYHNNDKLAKQLTNQFCQYDLPNFYEANGKIFDSVANAEAWRTLCGSCSITLFLGTTKYLLCFEEALALFRWVLDSTTYQVPACVWRMMDAANKNYKKYPVYWLSFSQKKQIIKEICNGQQKHHEALLLSYLSEPMEDEEIGERVVKYVYSHQGEVKQFDSSWFPVICRIHQVMINDKIESLEHHCGDVITSFNRWDGLLTNVLSYTAQVHSLHKKVNTLFNLPFSAVFLLIGLIPPVVLMCVGRYTIGVTILLLCYLGLLLPTVWMLRKMLKITIESIELRAALTLSVGVIALLLCLTLALF